jgi:flagellar hook-associated protein 2
MSTSAIFSGSSRFSSDFQAVVDRTVAIASLPMSQMQNAANDLDRRSSGLNSLDAKVGALQSAIVALSSGLGLASYTGSVSDSASLRATTSVGVREGTYSVEVTDFGSVAKAVGKASAAGIQKVTDPATQNVTLDATFQLYLNSTPISISPASKNLNALADSINQSGSGLQATVVNVGSTDQADYRLSLQSTAFAANTIQLKDASGNDLLDQPAGGGPVKYKANGGTEVTSSTRSATLAPGLTVDLLKASNPGVESTVTVTRSASAVSDALSSFVTAYNGVVTEIDKSRGSGAGSLKGDSILSTVSQALSHITGYTGGNTPIQSLTTLGLSFDSMTGNLKFDAVAFSEAADSKVSDLSDFLGSPKTGGFLQAAADALNGLEDSTNGVIQVDIKNLQQQISNQSDRISAEQDRIDQLRTDTQARMAAADALIASLEQQVTYFTSVFSAMSDASKSIG